MYGVSEVPAPRSKKCFSEVTYLAPSNFAAEPPKGCRRRKYVSSLFLGPTSKTHSCFSSLLRLVPVRPTSGSICRCLSQDAILEPSLRVFQRVLDFATYGIIAKSMVIRPLRTPSHIFRRPS